MREERNTSQDGSTADKPVAKAAEKTTEKRGKEARERILTEAKKLFREKGFEGVSLNEIVDAVGVKKPTIYYYFGDKQGLFAEVLVAMMRHGHDFIMANVRAGMTNGEKLEKLAEGYLRFCPTSLMSMVRDAMVYLHPAGQQAVLEAYDFYLLKPFERLFEDGINAGEIKAYDSRELTLTYLGLIDTITTQKTMLEGRAFDHKASAALIMEILFQGIQVKR